MRYTSAFTEYYSTIPVSSFKQPPGNVSMIVLQATLKAMDVRSGKILLFV
jgi:hypothetical protein